MSQIINSSTIIPFANGITWVESNLGLLIVFVVAALIGLGVFWMIRFGKKSSTQRLERAKSLDFEPLDELDPAVHERITNLYRSGQRQEIKVQNVFEQRRNDSVFFMLDILDMGGDDTSNLGEEVIMVVSPYLALPRFVLVPMIEMEGRLGDLMDKAMDKLLDMVGTRQGLVRVNFDQNPEIDDRFIIFGENPSLLQNYFTASYMSGFFNIKPRYEITAGGDTLIIKAIFPDRKKSRDESVREQYNDAEAVFRFLSQ